MIGYFKKITTMSFKIRDKQLWTKYNEIWKKLSLLNIKFEKEPVYGDNNKCKITKTTIHADSMITNFQRKKCQKKKHRALFINYNARFCYQIKEKILSWNTFGRIQIWTKKI